MSYPGNPFSIVAILETTSLKYSSLRRLSSCRTRTGPISERIRMARADSELTRVPIRPFGNPCWSSSNDAQVQSQNYPPQVTSRNSQSGQYTAPHSEQGRPQLQFRKILPAAQTSTTPGPLRHKAELRLPMFIRPISRVDPPRTQPIGQTLRNDLEMLPRVL
ncbi:hypothetical protein CISG_04253 [Coccidioides immitis RMSCC 3703]|uniref:Uncharacterized protein n=1 Tax=Coccidioides immitis RMSCC 3703 TaxID=454286 RepID=A0A0J8QQ24_COCIT|nr:hypothetical protein CISG_04253 [Coccidioides immitis RMSCC 3703]